MTGPQAMSRRYWRNPKPGEAKPCDQCGANVVFVSLSGRVSRCESCIDKIDQFAKRKRF